MNKSGGEVILKASVVEVCASDREESFWIPHLPPSSTILSLHKPV